MAGGQGFLGGGQGCPQPSPELGQDDVTLDNLCGVHEHTGEVGAVQRRGQLLQHQGLVQPRTCAPMFPAGAPLPQLAWEVLNEGTIAQPVEHAEVGEAAAGRTG